MITAVIQNICVVGNPFTQKHETVCVNRLRKNCRKTHGSAVSVESIDVIKVTSAIYDAV